MNFYIGDIVQAQCFSEDDTILTIYYIVTGIKFIDGIEKYILRTIPDDSGRDVESQLVSNSSTVTYLRVDYATSKGNNYKG